MFGFLLVDILRDTDGESEVDSLGVPTAH